jgi:predicted nucleotidyltransferase component of viral defense system
MTRTGDGAKLIEVLHLALLQALPSYLPQAHYIVKGGANLRLFEQSPRRSRDIDLDYAGPPDRFHLVEDKVDRALSSAPFRSVMDLAGINMSQPTKPKQTHTTRRWKFSVEGSGALLNSKIEFSNRGTDPEYALENARGDIGRALGLRVVRSNRYLPPAALRQKINALAARSQTEPRDVFDLDLLLSRYPDDVHRGDVSASVLNRAISRAYAISYDAYRQLVVEYLEDEFVAIYEREEAWSDMVLKVTTALETLR